MPPKLLIDDFWCNENLFSGLKNVNAV